MSNAVPGSLPSVHEAFGPCLSHTHTHTHLWILHKYVKCTDEKQTEARTWKDGSAVKNVCCSCKVLELSPQSPSQVAHSHRDCCPREIGRPLLASEGNTVTCTYPALCTIKKQDLLNTNNLSFARGEQNELRGRVGWGRGRDSDRVCSKDSMHENGPV